MVCLFPHSEHCDLKIFIYYYSGRKKQKLYMDKFNITHAKQVDKNHKTFTGKINEEINKRYILHLDWIIQ